jgi:hypothetical protein
VRRFDSSQGHAKNVTEPSKFGGVVALLAVVWPPDDFLEASLAAVREEQGQVAA